MGDLIKLHKSNFHEFLSEIQEAFEEDRLNDFICISSAKYPPGQEISGFTASVGKYWFSGDAGNTVQAIGLCELMKDHLLDYIKDKNLALEAADIVERDR